MISAATQALALDFSADGTRLAVLCKDRSLHLYDARRYYPDAPISARHRQRMLPNIKQHKFWIGGASRLPFATFCLANKGELLKERVEKHNTGLRERSRPWHIGQLLLVAANGTGYCTCVF
jgi:hypothetical protein